MRPDWARSAVGRTDSIPRERAALAISRGRRTPVFGDTQVAIKRCPSVLDDFAGSCCACHVHPRDKTCHAKTVRFVQIRCNRPDSRSPHPQIPNDSLVELNGIEPSAS